MKKRKESAKKATQNLVAHKKKDDVEKARVDKECATMEKEE